MARLRAIITLLPVHVRHEMLARDVTRLGARTSPCQLPCGLLSRWTQTCLVTLVVVVVVVEVRAQSSAGGWEQQGL